jgi:hypothetical protein
LRNKEVNHAPVAEVAPNDDFGLKVRRLVVALSAYVLAALFAQRRESAEHLTQSNMMLQRERDNRLINAQAITATIAHEVKQPLAAIVTNGGAGPGGERRRSW